MHVGIAHHLGWAVAVTADDDHRVVDRRRIELVGAGLPNAPIHHEGGTHELHRTGPVLDDDALAALVATVRASVVETAATELDDLASTLSSPIRTLSLRGWPNALPAGIADLRRPPHESRADSVMYTDVLADLAGERAWAVHRFDHGTVEAEAAAVLGTRADEVLRGPRATLGPPWAKDHRVALAATVLAARST